MTNNYGGASQTARLINRPQLLHAAQDREIPIGACRKNQIFIRAFRRRRTSSTPD